MSVTEVVPEGRTLAGRLAATGYELPEGLTFEEWAREGPTLIAMARSAMWWVGDWLRYGERRFGERYAQAVEATGYQVQTLRNAVWVCEKIPPAERRETLDFGHHEAVAGIKEPEKRAEILDRAETEGLTVGETREAVRRLKQEPLPPAPEDPETLLEIVSAVLDQLDEAVARHEWEPVEEARRLVRRAIPLARTGPGTPHSVGVFYCVAHNGVANEDEDRCDFAEVDASCDLRRLHYLEAAR